jgi:hypothetical protein
MERVWKILKETVSMELHSIARGTNYIVMLFVKLVQAYINIYSIRLPNFSVQEKLEIIIISEIFADAFLILFFFTYSPIREYIQRNWKEINTKFKEIWKR